MSYKDDWNRKHYDYTTLRTKYDIKKRVSQVAAYKNMSLNAYIISCIMKQLRKDEKIMKDTVITTVLS